jgi:hypothetical protein
MEACMELSTCPELKELSQALVAVYRRFHTPGEELKEIHGKLAKHRQECPTCRRNQIVRPLKAKPPSLSENL